MVQAASVKRLSRFVFVLVTLAVLLPACRTPPSPLAPLPPNVVKPLVSVAEFTNESGFKGSWKLGRDLSDLLMMELINSQRLIAVDRKSLGDRLSAISRQGHNLFRQEDASAPEGQKNARYLIRGIISEFTQTGSSSAWFKATSRAAPAPAERALVLIKLTVIDLESGEVISCQVAEGIIKVSAQWRRFDYSGVPLGGELFFKTPLGRATQQAITAAAQRIIRDIPYATWQPHIADATAASVLINGGENVGVREGDLFNIRAANRAVSDPSSGNIIAQAAGEIVGQIRITEVYSSTAAGIVLSGHPSPGLRLEKVLPAALP